MSLLIENCRVWGSDARSVYVDGGVIQEVSVDPTQTVPFKTLRIDGHGATLLPGLTDTHCHLFELGASKRSVDLRGMTSITALRFRLEANVRRAPAGSWVSGFGWDQEAFSEGRYPTRGDIDPVSPDNPVLLTRICGHIALANTRAIETLSLASAAGEEYERDRAGALTGIIKERALEQVLARVPGGGVEREMENLMAAEQEAARLGLTTVHCILSSDGYRQELDALARLRSEGRLALRYRLYVPPAALAHIRAEALREKLTGDDVRLCGVKVFADGSLGARTAALRQPYSDDRANSGTLRYSDAELLALASEADEAGYQLMVHAIGDRAVEQAVRALDTVTSKRNERRHRMEHVSLAPEDLRREIKRAGLRVGVQPHFAISDTWARGRLGDERARDLYPLGSILAEGIVASGGSDCPVETLSPVLGMWAAMVGAEHAPNERLELEDAVALYTTNAASNGFDEARFGSVREGSVGDLVLLDSDISGMHPALLRKVGVAATIVGGAVVYSYEGVGSAGV